MGALSRWIKRLTAIVKSESGVGPDAGAGPEPQKVARPVVAQDQGPGTVRGPGPNAPQDEDGDDDVDAVAAYVVMDRMLDDQDK